MKPFIFLVVLVLFILSIYYYFSVKGKCITPNNETKDNRIDKIQRAQKNLHPHYNKNVDRGPKGRFKKKD
ncbi:hypothetical protein N8587_01535 [Akkermansiaceae bacterium]|nr:hypothetical protein [Akkermansiaceae bacterium]